MPYTLSIILYQLIFMMSFLGLTNIIHNALSIILAMFLAVSFIDIYIIKIINFKFPTKLDFDWKLILGILKYSLPLIITTSSYWLVYHMPRFIFQYNNDYLSCAIFGISCTLVWNIMDCIAGLFTFVSFPVVVKIFENHANVKEYFSKIVNLFLCIIMPIIATFCLYSKDIVRIILPEKYYLAESIIPLITFTSFFHHFLKLINIKYHLSTQTYIESVVAAFGAIIYALFMLHNLHKLDIITACCIVMTVLTIFVIVNLFIKLKNESFIDYFSVFKTFIIMILINAVCYGFNAIIFQFDNVIINILKVLFFLLFNYLIFWCLRHKILNN